MPRNEEEQYRLCFEHAREAIYVVQDSVVRLANPMCEVFTGRPVAELLGRRIESLMATAAEAEEVREHHEKFTRGELTSSQRDFRVVSTYGVEYWLSVNAVRIDWRGAPASLNFASNVTSRHRSEQALRESESYNKLLFASSRQPLVVLDPEEGRFIDCNDAAARIYGLEKREDVLGLSVLDVSAPVQYDGSAAEVAARRQIERARKSGVLRFEWRHRRPNGIFWDGDVHLMAFRHGGRDLLQFSLEDITARKRTEEQLKLAASVFAHANEGIVITDAEGLIIDANPTFSRLTGYSRDEVLGHNPRMLNSGHHEPAFYAEMWQAISTQGTWQGEIWNRRKDGEIYPELLTISAVRGHDGGVNHYVGIFSDISELKARESNLRHLAYNDVLTGLPNRLLLQDRLRQALAHARRANARLAVCYLDLDGFKAVNDTHGHAEGDRLLVEVAARLRQSVREGDTVARLGGDEFVLLLLDLEEAAECEGTLERVACSLNEPITLGNGEAVTISASMGYTLFPDDAASEEELLVHADEAMYLAKAAGRHCVRRYTCPDPAGRD